MLLHACMPCTLALPCMDSMPYREVATFTDRCQWHGQLHGPAEGGDPLCPGGWGGLPPGRVCQDPVHPLCGVSRAWGDPHPADPVHQAGAQNAVVPCPEEHVQGEDNTPRKVVWMVGWIIRCSLLLHNNNRPCNRLSLQIQSNWSSTCRLHCRSRNRLTHMPAYMPAVDPFKTAPAAAQAM